MSLYISTLKTNIFYVGRTLRSKHFYNLPLRKLIILLLARHNIAAQRPKDEALPTLLHNSVSNVFATYIIMSRMHGSVWLAVSLLRLSQIHKRCVLVRIL